MPGGSPGSSGYAGNSRPDRRPDRQPESGGEAERDNDRVIVARQVQVQQVATQAAVMQIQEEAAVAEVMAMAEAEATKTGIEIVMDLQELGTSESVVATAASGGGGGGSGVFGLPELPPLTTEDSPIFGGINPIYLLGGFAAFVGYLAYVRR